MKFMARLLARIYGYDSSNTFDEPRIDWADWVVASPLLLCAGFLLLAAAGAWFYLKFQPLKSRGVQASLAVVRAGLLCLVLLLLAEPTLVVPIARQTKPTLYLLFDGSESMAMQDAPLDAPSPSTATSGSQAKQSRLEQLKSIVGRDGGATLRKLNERFDLQAYQFSARGGALTPIGAAEPGRVDVKVLVGALKADGDETDLGDALAKLRSANHDSQTSGGAIVFSDFNHNFGLHPSRSGAGKSTPNASLDPFQQSPAGMLKTPLYCVGFGPKRAFDVEVSLQAQLLMKKGEQSTLTARIECDSPAARELTIRLSARPIGGTGPVQAIDERRVQIGGGQSPGGLAVAEFKYVPEETGRFEFIAEVDRQPDETIVENNVSMREVNVRDDFLHLMFVDYEPNWEWRFIKEVFHRDPLVGLRGFRTFLRSADPKVRQTNELFLASLPPPRNEFFVNDVVFLGDMPATSLSTRYCEMVKEFVDKFGGGLVIVSGPEFGPAELANTPLADLLPVRPIPGGKMVDQKNDPFTPQLTAAAAEIDFMQLADNARENAELWSRLGPLDWYQPSASVRTEAGTRVLLEHPTAKCADNRTPQPLLAVRPYGKGEVVYLAMNETWRLRREFGEKYYRQFWAQMIHRLGLSHALGDQKRFVVKSDRKQYRTGQRASVVVEAYDQNYEPLNLSKLQPALTHLVGELAPPASAAGGGGPARKTLRLTQFREGEFHAEFDVLEAGEYVVRVRDPLTSDDVELTLHAAGGSLERQSAVRNEELQLELARLTEGLALEPEEFSTLAERIPAPPPSKKKSGEVEFELWNTWPAFLLIVMLMIVEWFVRKWLHLA